MGCKYWLLQIGCSWAESIIGRGSWPWQSLWQSFPLSSSSQSQCLCLCQGTEALFCTVCVCMSVCLPRSVPLYRERLYGNTCGAALLTTVDQCHSDILISFHVHIVRVPRCSGKPGKRMSHFPVMEIIWNRKKRSIVLEILMFFSKLNPPPCLSLCCEWRRTDYNECLLFLPTPSQPHPVHQTWHRCSIESSGSPIVAYLVEIMMMTPDFHWTHLRCQQLWSIHPWRCWGRHAGFPGLSGGHQEEQKPQNWNLQEPRSVIWHLYPLTAAQTRCHQDDDHRAKHIPSHVEGKVKRKMTPEWNTQDLWLSQLGLHKSTTNQRNDTEKNRNIEQLNIEQYYWSLCYYRLNSSQKDFYKHQIRVDLKQQHSPIQTVPPTDKRPLKDTGHIKGSENGNSLKEEKAVIETETRPQLRKWLKIQTLKLPAMFTWDHFPDKTHVIPTSHMFHTTPLFHLDPGDATVWH